MMQCRTNFCRTCRILESLINFLSLFQSIRVTKIPREVVTRHATKKETRLYVLAHQLTSNLEKMENHVKLFIHVTNPLREVANRFVERREMKLCVVVMKDTEFPRKMPRNAKRVSK